MTMFENDDLTKANKTSGLVWAIIGGLLVLGILTNVTKNGYAPLIGGVIAGLVIYSIVKARR